MLDNGWQRTVNGNRRVVPNQPGFLTKTDIRERTIMYAHGEKLDRTRDDVTLRLVSNKWDP